MTASGVRSAPAHWGGRKFRRSVAGRFRSGTEAQDVKHSAFTAHQTTHNPVPTIPSVTVLSFAQQSPTHLPPSSSMTQVMLVRGNRVFRALARDIHKTLPNPKSAREKVKKINPRNTFRESAPRPKTAFGREGQLWAETRSGRTEGAVLKDSFRPRGLAFGGRVPPRAAFSFARTASPPNLSDPGDSAFLYQNERRRCPGASPSFEWL